MRSIILSILIILLFAHIASAKNMQEGLALYKNGNYAGAEAVFRELNAKNPYDYSSKYMLAVTLVKMHRYNEAKELYRTVIEKSNNKSLVSMCNTGLANLGETVEVKPRKEITKAVLNVNAQGGGIIVKDVMLNSTLKRDFILDTGATHVMITNKTAAQLNIPVNTAPKVQILTGNGYITVPLVKIPEIEVKGLIVKDVEAIVSDLGSSATDNGIEGLLGMSFLGNFKMTVDRPNNQVILEKN